MAETKANNLHQFLQDLADTIRSNDGTTAAINPQDYSSRIQLEANKDATPSDSQDVVITPSSGKYGLKQVTVKKVTGGTISTNPGSAGATILDSSISVASSDSTALSYQTSAPTSGNYYTITETPSLNGVQNPTYQVSKAGYISSPSTATGIAIQAGTMSPKSIYIKKASLGAGVTGNIEFTPSVSTTMATITKPATGTDGTDYFSITGSGTKSGTVTGTANVSSAGYAPSTLTGSGGSATGSVKADDKKYIAKGGLSAEQVSQGTASMSTTTMATASSSDYYVTLSTTAGSARAKTTSAGYNKSGATSDAAQVNVSGNGNKLYIKAGTATADNIAPVTTVNNLQANASASSDNVELTEAAGKPESGFYIKATGGSSAKTVAGTESTVTTTAGYIADGSFKIKPSIEIQKVSHGQYYSIPSATLSANATQESAGSASVAMTTVAEDASQTSPYYVTLNTTAGSAKGHAGTASHGYTENATADQAGTTTIAVTGNGTKKYIKDAGMPSVSDSQLSVSPSVTPTPVASATGNISLTASASAPTSGYYIKVTGGNSATEGSATAGESSEVTWATGYTTASTASTKKTITSTAKAKANANSKDQYYTVPGSNRTASLSNNTSASIAVAATTTVATSSTATDYYVDITKTDGSVTPRASTSGGYIDNSYTDGAPQAVTVSGPSKVYIKAASTPSMAALTGAGDVGVDIYEVAAASQDTNLDLSKVDVNTKDITAYYFKVGAKGTTKTVKSGAVTVAESGYMTGGTKIAAENKTANVTANEKVEYVNIKKAALGADVSTTAGSATMSSSSVIKSSAATDFHVDLATTAGKATGSANVSTEGYAKSETATSSEKDVAVSGNGDKFYIQAAVLGASSSQDTAGSASNSATGMVTSTTATDHYVTLSTTAGKAKGSASTTTAGYTAGATATQSGTTSIAVTGNGSKTYIRDATLSATVSSNTGGSASMGSTTVTQSTEETAYHVDLTTTAGSVKAKASVTAEGYATSADNKETSATSVAVSGNGDKFYIPQATIQGGVSGNITFTPSVSTNMATITKPSTGTEGTDYFSVTGSGSKSGTVTGTSKATGSGYITKDTVGSTGGSATGSVGSDAKKYVAKATLGAEQTQAGSASMSSSTVAQSQTATDYHVDLTTAAGKARGKTGTVGYLPASQVSSAVDVTVSGNGSKFYIPGAATPTLGDMTGAGDVGIDIYEVASTSQDTNLDLSKVDVSTKDTAKYYFKVGAKGTTKTVSSGKVNVSSAGYMTAGDKIAAGNKSASVTANETVEYVNLNKGTLSASVSSNSSGSASMDTSTMEKVSSSDYYVTLSTTAGSVKAKATVGTEGYVKSESNETSATSVSVSGNGNKLYIKPATASKTDATASASVSKQPAATASTSVTGMVTTTTNTGYSVSASASAASGVATASVTASSASVTSGYSTGVSTSTSAKSATSTEATKSASDAKYIQKGVLGAEVSSNSGGSASMSTDTMVTSATATNYHVDLTTSAGSVKAKAKVNTEGYVKNETAETSATSVSVSGNGNKVYIPGAGHTVSGSVTNATATTTVAPGNVSIAQESGGTVSTTPTATKPSSGAYLAVKATAAANSTGTTSSITGSGTAKDVTTAGYDPSGTYTGSISVSGTATAKTSAKDSGTVYLPINTTDVVEKAGTLNTTNNTYTQGKVTVDTAGWIATGDKIGGATFANSATTGVTYKDISSTTAAPVLVTQDYLYINKGYTDSVKISLAKLVPDGASADLASGDILSGKSAYDSDGKLIAGNIPTKTDSGNVTLNDSTTSKSYPAGYYPNAHGATHATVDIPNPTMSFNATTKKVSATGSWTKGFTVDTSYSNSYEVTLNDAKAVTGTASLSVDDSTATADATITLSPSVTPTASASATGNISLGTKATSQPSSGYYIKVTGGSAEATSSAATGKKKVSSGDGYITAGSKTIGASATAKSNATSTDAWYPVTGGSFAATTETPAPTSLEYGKKYKLSAGYFGSSAYYQVPADRYNTGYNAGYSAGDTAGQATGKTNYEPKSATITNAGSLTVKNAAGTTVYTSTISPNYNGGYNAGVAATKVGTAIAGDVLTGKTFTNSSGVGIDGTMPNNGDTSKEITSNGGSYTIPAGYTSGGTVTTKTWGASDFASGDVELAKQTGTSVVGKSTASVRSASGWAISSASGSSMSVGALSSGVYPVTATIKATSAPSTAGWTASTGELTKTSVSIGSLTKGEATNNTTLPSGSTSSGTLTPGSYVKIGAGYYPSALYYKGGGQSVPTATYTASATVTNADITGYGKLTIGGASGWAISSAAGSSMSVGDKGTDGKYPVTATIKATSDPTTAGWATSTGELTKTSVAIGSLAAGSATVAGGGLSGGGLTAGDGEVIGTDTAELEDTDNSGIEIKGRGSVTRAAVTRAAVTRKYGAGYVPTETTPSTVIDADSTTIGETSKTSNLASKYLKTATINAGKTLDGVIIKSGGTLTKLLNAGTIGYFPNDGTITNLDNGADHHGSITISANDGTVTVSQNHNTATGKLAVPQNTGKIEISENLNPTGWTGTKALVDIKENRSDVAVKNSDTSAKVQISNASGSSITVSNLLAVQDANGTTITSAAGSVLSHSPSSSITYGTDSSCVPMTSTAGWLGSKYLTDLVVDNGKKIKSVNVVGTGTINNIYSRQTASSSVSSTMKNIKYNSPHGMSASIGGAGLEIGDIGSGSSQIYVKAANSSGFLHVLNGRSVPGPYALDLDIDTDVSDVFISSNSGGINSLYSTWNNQPGNNTPATRLEGVYVNDDQGNILEVASLSWGELVLRSITNGAILTLGELADGTLGANPLEITQGNPGSHTLVKPYSNSIFRVDSIAGSGYGSVPMSIMTDGSTTPHSLIIDAVDCRIKTMTVKPSGTNADASDIPAIKIIDSNAPCAKFATERSNGGQGLVNIKATKSFNGYCGRSDTTSNVWVQTGSTCNYMTHSSSRNTPYTGTITSTNTWTYVSPITHDANNGTIIMLTRSNGTYFTAGSSIYVGISVDQPQGTTSAYARAFSVPDACGAVVISIGHTGSDSTQTKRYYQASAFYIK